MLEGQRQTWSTIGLNPKVPAGYVNQLKTPSNEGVKEYRRHVTGAGHTGKAEGNFERQRASSKRRKSSGCCLLSRFTSTVDIRDIRRRAGTSQSCYEDFALS